MISNKCGTAEFPFNLWCPFILFSIFSFIPTCEWLNSLESAQKKSAVKSGLRNTLNLCFVKDRMELVTNNAVNKCLRSICKKLNIKQITCHSLRHTHASMLLYKGINIKYISRRLGHKNVITTLDTYSHVIDELEQQDSELTDLALNDLYSLRKNVQLH